MKYYLHKESDREYVPIERKGSLLLLKGTSGVGKGTRVRYLLEWMRSKEQSVELWFDDNRGRRTQLGVLVPSANLLFLGRMTPHKYHPEILSWYSLDYVNRVFEKATETTALAKELLKNFNVIAEGNPGLASFRWRSKFALEELGAAGCMSRFYCYRKDPEEYLKRVTERTGVPPKSMAAWKQNQSFRGQYELETAEIKDGGLQNCDVELCEFDQPVQQFGVDVLDFLKIHGIVEYQEFCQSNNYHRKDVSHLAPIQ